MNANPTTANHLAELHARLDAHLEALRSRATDAQAALESAAAALADAAGGRTPPHR